MKLSDSFPVYPYSLVTPKGSKVKIGTRKIYADIDPEVYHFIYNVVHEISKGRKINVKKEWNAKVKSNSNLLYGEKKIITIFRYKDTANGIDQIRYKINWDLLEMKLENESKNIVDEIKKNPNIGLGILYDKLSYNYYENRKSTRSSPYVSIRKIKIRMKNMRDYVELKGMKEKIREICYKIEEKYPTDSFLELSNRLNEYILNLDFNGIYYTLRELSERLFPILFVNAIVRLNKRDNIAVTSLYLIYLNYSIREFWRDKGKRPKRLHIEDRKSLEKPSIDLLNKVNSYGLINVNGSLNIAGIDTALESNDFKLPLVYISAKSFKVLLEVLGGDCSYDFERIYDVCSSSIHNILSIPSSSILELKVAKNFMMWYSDCLEKILRKLNILTTTFAVQRPSREKPIRNHLSTLIDFLDANREVLKDSIKKSMKDDIAITYDLVRALFVVYGIGASKLRKNYGDYKDFQEFVSYISEGYYNFGFVLIGQELEKIGKIVKRTLTDTEARIVLKNYDSDEIGYVALILYFQYWERRKTNGEN